LQINCAWFIFYGDHLSNLKDILMFRSGVRHFLSASAALCLLLTLFFAQPQTASAFYTSVTDYDELVQAIIDANSAGGGVIILDDQIMGIDAEEYLNTGTAFPIIESDVTILGTSTIIWGGLMLNTPAPFRAFSVAPNGKLTLSNINISDFYIDSGEGGVIYNQGEVQAINTQFMQNGETVSGSISGGVIYNTASGTFYLRESIFLGNYYESTQPILGNLMFNQGVTILENSFIVINGAESIDDTTSANFYNVGTLTLNHVTMLMNITSVLTDPADPDSVDPNAIGGIYSSAGSTTNIFNSVLTMNMPVGCQFDGMLNHNDSYTFAVNMPAIPPDPDNNEPGRDAIIVPPCIPLTEITPADLGNIDIEDILLGAFMSMLPMPGTPLYNNAGANAIPYDMMGMPSQGLRDVGPIEYMEDENGDFISDVDYPFVYFSAPNGTVSEDVGTAYIEIAIEFCDLGCGVPFGGIFDIYISDDQTGTATFGADYTGFTDFNIAKVTVDCTSGCPATVQLPIDIVWDQIPEADETIQLSIISTNGYSWIDPVEQLDFELTIQDVEPIYPTVVDVLDANGVSIDGITYTASVDELTIQFNADVFDDGTGSDPDSASNPANYILLREGAVAGYQTADCASWISPDDEQISFADVSYDSSNYVTTLTFNPALSDGDYRLIICGTTSIVSAVNRALHLNNGVDVSVDFTIAIPVTPTPVTPTSQPTAQVTAIPTVIAPTTPEAPSGQPSQPEDLGVFELPATGERPLWAELLAEWFGW
jgi:hypothetical protein